MSAIQMSAAAPGRTGSAPTVNRRRLVLGSARELGTIGVVSGLAGAFAAILVMSARILATLAGDMPTLSVMLDSVAGLFIAISLYVAAMVTVNCVATVLAGRRRHLALLRLLGASGADLRRSVAAGTARVGAVGAVTGVLLGTALADLARVLLVGQEKLPDRAYPWVAPQLLVGVLVVTATATLAGWLGSRGVLSVSPASAATTESAERHRFPLWRKILGALGMVGGLTLMAVSMELGERGSGAGVMVAFVGCASFGTGLLIGAQAVVPRLVAGVGALFGPAAPVRIARRNAVLDPARATRSTMGLTLGVALVTTFAAGARALQASVPTWGLDPLQQLIADQVLTMASTVMISLVCVSTVIAAVGFASTMSLTVIQRRREMGLLRALGFTRGQIRLMISAEAVALAVTAVGFGIVIGVVFGTVGAQSLIGALNNGLVWGIPGELLAVIGAGGLLLVVLASQLPARRAVKVAPVTALHTD